MWLSKMSKTKKKRYIIIDILSVFATDLKLLTDHYKHLITTKKWEPLSYINNSVNKNRLYDTFDHNNCSCLRRKRKAFSVVAIRSVNVLHHVMIHNTLEREGKYPVKKRSGLEYADFASYVREPGKTRQISNQIVLYRNSCRIFHIIIKKARESAIASCRSTKSTASDV